MKENNGSCATTFVILLQIAFVTLKLLGVITWSWWWVLSPVLLYIAGSLIILLVLSAIAIFAGVMGWI